MERAEARLESIGRDLFEKTSGQLASRRARLELAARALETTSPYAVLERGYSITRDAEGRAIRSVAELDQGAELETVLSSGRVRSKVTALESEDDS